ncbi:hypothetical protein H0I76_05955 [Limibaculum sp. M0105]|uniref:SH3 domain-containing protein n=1 Tax=Thermohalobaculum xanthum TaxID=2753746 RepID=A0A8J7M718_9RHOB|nr:hypothetical protein [Thermohalobaculum xanthum]MBK0398724.1 hypothetical protein [Thermohalobaculum xanthum]
MRNLSIAILAISALGLVGWWLTFDSDEARARLVEDAARKSSTVALTAMLTDHKVFAFSGIVVGKAAAPKTRDFRAMVQSNGALRPAFGEAEYTCYELAGRPECWRLTALEVDGVKLPLGPAGKVIATAEAPAEASAPAETAEATAATASTDDMASEPGDEPVRTASADAATASDALPPEPPKRPLEEAADDTSAHDTLLAAIQSTNDAPVVGPVTEQDPTHVVSVSLANARSGPSTDNAIKFTLKRNVPLHMIENDGRWGHFRVLEGDEAGETVWMAFSTITAISDADGN